MGYDFIGFTPSNKNNLDNRHVVLSCISSGLALYAPPTTAAPHNIEQLKPDPSLVVHLSQTALIGRNILGKEMTYEQR